MLSIFAFLLLAAEPPSKGPTPELTAGRVVSGTLPTEGTATYRLQLKSGQRVEIDSLSTTIDTKLTLLDAAQKEIAENLDGGVNRNAKLHVQAPLTRALNHTYFVRVGNEAKQAGKYEILVRERNAAAPAAPLPISAGQEVTGRLGPDSPILPGDGHPYAVHQFQGSAGTRVRISLQSGEFDPKVYLRLAGTAVAENDDGGVGNASQLVHRLDKDGAYEIWASAIDTLKASSAYRLALAEVPAPAAAPTVEVVAWGQPLPGRVGDGDALIKRFDLGGASPTGRQLARLSDGCITSGIDRPHRLYRLQGAAGQRARITLKRDGEAAERCQLLVEVGAITPAGFASVSRRALAPTARVEFESAGEMLIRVSVPTGGNAAYTLLVEDEPAPVPTTPANPAGARAIGADGG